MIQFGSWGAYLLSIGKGQGAYLSFKNQRNMRNRALMFIWEGQKKKVNELVVPTSFLVKAKSQAIAANISFVWRNCALTWT